MKTSLRLASVIALIVGAHLTIPKIVETAAAFNAASTNRYELSVEDHLNNNATEAYVSENTYRVVTLNNYEPPNYGGPDSQYGSGTR